MVHRASGIVEDLPEQSRAWREPLPSRGCLHLEKVWVVLFIAAEDLVCFWTKTK